MTPTAKRLIIPWKKDFRDIDKEEAKKLAKLIDKYGSINAPKRRDYYAPHISLKMTGKIPVFLANLLGGGFYVDKEESPKPIYEFEINKKNDIMKIMEFVKMLQSENLLEVITI